MTGTRTGEKRVIRVSAMLGKLGTLLAAFALWAAAGAVRADLNGYHEAADCSVISVRT